MRLKRKAGPQVHQVINLYPNPRLRGAVGLGATNSDDESGLVPSPSTAASLVHDDGDASLELAAQNDSVDTFVTLGEPGVALPFEMTPGRTYTFSADLSLRGPLTGILSADTRRIVVDWDVPEPADVTKARSECGPNIESTTRLSATFSLPADATGVRIRLMLGASAGHGSVRWSKLSLTEGHFPHEFFDGDSNSTPTREFVWLGSPFASPSASRAVVDAKTPASPERLEAAADQFDTADIQAQLADSPELLATAVGRYAQGVVAEGEGAMKRARKHHEASIDLDPTLWGPRYRLARVSLDRGFLAKAIAVLVPVADDPRTPADILYRLTRRLGRVGRRNDADRLRPLGAERDHVIEGPLGERLKASHANWIGDRSYMVAMFRDRIDEIRARAHQSLAEVEAQRERIFVFWGQGIHEAPPVVQACHRQMLEVHPPGSVVTLSLADLPYFVDIPPTTSERVGDNLTLLSDVIRIELLKKYGGYWLDATCWPSRDVQEVEPRIERSEFFAFGNNDVRISSWFMAARNSSYIVHMMSAAMAVYWETHDYLVNYFLIHYTFEALALNDPEFERLWNECDRLSSLPPHRLQRQMFDPYDPEIAEALKDESFLHKLTYKSRRKELKPDSFVAALVRGDF